MYDIKVVGAAAGAEHTVICTGEGEVYTCGNGGHGALGHGGEEDEPQFCIQDRLYVRAYLPKIPANFGHQNPASEKRGANETYDIGIRWAWKSVPRA